MNSLSDCYKLYNNVGIPCLGFGTWQMPNNQECVNAVKYALDVGYRHIDTAMIYGNEESVGKGIKACDVDRSDIFVTTKLWNVDQGYESALKAFNISLAKLGLDYIDLYLIHWPIPKGHKSNYKDLNIQSWKAFEKLYKDGLVKAIGVSNFLPHQLDNLINNTDILPMVNQIEYHPGWMQAESIKYCNDKNIIIEAWSPLASGKVFEVSEIVNLSKKYNKSVSQICLRWCLQHGTVPLSKSVSNARIDSNKDIFNFNISIEDMHLIDSLINCCGEGANPDILEL